MKERTPFSGRAAPTLAAQRRAAAERRAARLRREDIELELARLQQLEAEAPTAGLARAWATLRKRRAAQLDEDAIEG